jgi:hypothetical protein
MFALLTGVVYGPGLTMDPGYIKYGPGFLDCKPVHRPVIASDPYRRAGALACTSSPN